MNIYGWHIIKYDTGKKRFYDANKYILIHRDSLDYFSLKYYKEAKLSSEYVFMSANLHYRMLSIKRLKELKLDGFFLRKGQGIHEYNGEELKLMTDLTTKEIKGIAAIPY
jgi:hypothetical protein